MELVQEQSMPRVLRLSNTTIPEHGLTTALYQRFSI